MPIRAVVEANDEHAYPQSPTIIIRSLSERKKKSGPPRGRISVIDLTMGQLLLMETPRLSLPGASSAISSSMDREEAAEAGDPDAVVEPRMETLIHPDQLE